MCVRATSRWKRRVSSQWQSTGRPKIDETDLEKGLRAYSLDLITEADQELTDILGVDTSLIYHFIGEGKNFSQVRISDVIVGAGIDPSRVSDVIKFMIYYGFLGIHTAENGVKYIFDVGYDMKLMQVLVAKAGDDVGCSRMQFGMMGNAKKTGRHCSRFSLA